jgi:hypothetical protein
MYNRPHMAMPRFDLDYIVSVDLGQTTDYTAIAVVHRQQSVAFDPDTLVQQPPVISYQLLHLERPELGTPYPAIVARCLALLDRPPLTRATPFVVDRTGVGRPVVDMFTEAGVEPESITIHGGDEVNTTEYRHYRVPKRDLIHTLLKLYQKGVFKVAPGISLAGAMVNELVNFQLKVNIATGHDSYEALRESIHDDLVLAVAMAVWYAEYQWSKHQPVSQDTIDTLSRLHDPDFYLQ